jgi:integrase/recombinase XerD
MKATTAIILDTRYKKTTSDTYPVRLRITYKKIQKYYPTSYNLTESQWKKMRGSRPDELKETWLLLSAIEKKASGIIDKMRLFAFTEFKKHFDRTSTDTSLLSTAFTEYIKCLYENDQVGTAISYSNAKNSLERFKKDLSFAEATPELLKQYERWMLKKGNSYTTIGMYLRNVRSLFNKAIADGEIEQSAYPFGNRKYTIPKGSGKKTALPISEMALINNYKAPKDSVLEMTQAYFMFMYLGNGINPKDTCLLKFPNMDGEYIRFKREKTIRTKTDQEAIVIHLKPQMMKIIRKWGNPNNPDNYIFPILSQGMDAITIKQKVRDFTCLLNKNLKIIASEVGIDKNLTTYVARHSFSTVLKRSGASTELISEALGHSDLKTTKNYLSSFEDDTMKKATDALMAFKNHKTPTRAKVVNL